MFCPINPDLDHERFAQCAFDEMRDCAGPVNLEAECATSNVETMGPVRPAIAPINPTPIAKVTTRSIRFIEFALGIVGSVQRQHREIYC